MLISAGDPTAVARAADTLMSAGVVALPTDTVYGIAALASSQVAIDRLFEMKGRDRAKPLAVFAGTLNQASDLAALDGAATAEATKGWPGALTLVLRAKQTELATRLGSDETIGIRIPDHELVLKIIELTGPLAVTSANLSGEPVLVTAEQIVLALAGWVDLVIDGGTLGGKASRVIDYSKGTPQVLRP